MASRKTGPDKRTVHLLHERAGGLCEICGFAEAQQIHHRQPRGMGGTRDLSTNACSNLTFICHLCHGRIESYRSKAIADGHIVSKFCVSAETPFLYRGTLRILDDEGGWMNWSGST